MESKKQNEQTKQKQTHRSREPTDSCQIGGGEADGERSEKCEGINKYKLAVLNGHRDVKYSTGNRVNKIVITIYGARCVLELSG